ncbi:hypothetical protein BDP81DRAFT_83080 [Colletotrichum phormii]|uniref:Uncharacterized protein n=1 Tax=Colletotrichum phormii TaxID=359342 RepID=A0AAJ0EJU0_9PEZI|nr:uncharacterized protein BDP81DRAFT_83080 [Colletotrichum phormii]KAK1654421.1 hypothetical protein BDP81DRAFT_83080 [Colletotrichum phormii]
MLPRPKPPRQETQTGPSSCRWHVPSPALISSTSATRGVWVPPSLRHQTRPRETVTRHHGQRKKRHALDGRPSQRKWLTHSSFQLLSFFSSTSVSAVCTATINSLQEARVRTHYSSRPCHTGVSCLLTPEMPAAGRASATERFSGDRSLVFTQPDAH